MDEVEIVIPTAEELSRQPETDIPCPEEGCGMVFRTRASLQMHVVKTHGFAQDKFNSIIYGRGGKQMKKVRLFYCPVKDCPRGLNQQNPFRRKDTLRHHYFVCHGEKKFTCSKCGRGFGTLTTQKRHETVCGQIFYCSCQCPFKSKESLLMHAKRKGHALQAQYQKVQSKKSKQTKANQQPSLNILEICAKMRQTPATSQNVRQTSGLSLKPQFILPKPKVISASQAALLHPENTTLVTVSNGVITDIKELKPVQTSKRPHLTQTIKIDITDVFNKKQSLGKPNLSDAQAQWCAMDTADSRQDSSTNTYLGEHVADQQIQALPEMLTVGTNFPGLAETDAHTQTNIPLSNKDGHCPGSNAKLQVVDIGNSMSDALVQTMPLFRVGTLSSDQTCSSGQNMETQTSSDLLLQAMMSAMLQRQDCNQQTPFIINAHNQTSGEVVRSVGEALNVSQAVAQNTSSQTQTNTPLNQAITNPKYVTLTSHNNIQTDHELQYDRIQDCGSSTNVTRKRLLPRDPSLNTKSSTNCLPTMVTEHTKSSPFGKYGQKELNISMSGEPRYQTPQKNLSVPAENAKLNYLECLEIENTSESHQQMSMEERSAETNTIGIQAENNINSEHEFSTIDLIDPFPDFGDVFLESIATQTYSEEQLSPLGEFMQQSSQRDLVTQSISETSTWTAASIHKSFMGESFEDLPYTDSGSQTDEFQDFVFENQFSTRTSALIYDTDDDQQNNSSTEKHSEEAASLNGISVTGVGHMETNEIDKVVSNNEKSGHTVTAMDTFVELNGDVDKSSKKLTTNPAENPVGLCSSPVEQLAIEREEESVGFTDVETQADIYPLKRTRFNTTMSNNETQTKCSASDKSKPDAVVTITCLQEAPTVDSVLIASKKTNLDVSTNINRPSTQSYSSMLDKAELEKAPDAMVTTTCLQQSPTGDSALTASKTTNLNASKCIERSSTNNQNVLPKYCNAEIQADITVKSMSTVGTSVDTQTKHKNSNTDGNREVLQLMNLS